MTPQNRERGIVILFCTIIPAALPIVHYWLSGKPFERGAELAACFLWTAGGAFFGLLVACLIIGLAEAHEQEARRIDALFNAGNPNKKGGAQ